MKMLLNMTQDEFFDLTCTGFKDCVIYLDAVRLQPHG